MIDNCPFCNDNLLWEGDFVVVEDQFCKGIVSPNSKIPNAIMIVPRVHRETVFDLTPDEFASTYKLLHEAKSKIDETCCPEGYIVGWKCGDIGGQEVMHAHMHVVPRFKEEKYAGRGIHHWIKTNENRENLKACSKIALKR